MRAPLLALISFLALSVYGRADTAVYECIKTTEPDEVYRLEPNGSSFETIAHFSTRLSSPTDLVIGAGFTFAESTDPASTTQFRLRVNDRIDTGLSTIGVIGGVPMTRHIRGFAPGQSGLVTVELQARNLSPQQVDIWQVWINPLALPHADNSRDVSASERITVNNRWTSLLAESIDIQQGSVLASGFVQIPSAASDLDARSIRFRFRVENQVRMLAGVAPGALADGVVLGSFFQIPDRGFVTIHLEAIAIGGELSLETRSLHLQAMDNYSVFSGSTNGAKVLPDDELRYPVASSGPTVIEPISRGFENRRTFGWGFAHILLGAGVDTEVKGYPRLVGPDGYTLWCAGGGSSAPCPPSVRPGDVGILDIASYGSPRMDSYLMGWDGPLGIDENISPDLIFEVFGLCNTEGEIFVEELDFQLVVLPDELGEEVAFECEWETEGIVLLTGGEVRRQCYSTGAQAGPYFSDGFESGSTSAWSSTPSPRSRLR